MHIKDPKHVHKHRVVILSTFVGILIVFGVWAVQAKQMFAQHAARTISQESTTNYAQQLQNILPDIDQELSALLEGSQESVAREQAQEESEALIIDELKQRFEQKDQEEADEAGEVTEQETIE